MYIVGLDTAMGFTHIPNYYSSIVSSNTTYTISSINVENSSPDKMVQFK